MRRPTVPRKRNRPELDKPADCQVSDFNALTGTKTACPGKADHLVLAGRSVISICCRHRVIVGSGMPTGWIVL